MENIENVESQFILRKVVDGYLLDCSARKLTHATLLDYRNTCQKLMRFIGEDKPIDEITRMDMRGFFAEQTVCNKTLLCYYHTIKSLFNLAIGEEILEKNPMDGLKRPRPEVRTVEPIPSEHIKLILKTIDKYNIVTRVRNNALIFMLLDTGCRVSELCSIKCSELNTENRSVKIMGKRSMERVVYYSPSTAKALWRYMGNNTTDGYLFVAEHGTPLTRRGVTAALLDICNKAGVPFYSPHKFRHTFAITYLRSGGNIFTLQRTLGDTTLDMTKKYLLVTDVDTKKAHDITSPVLNLGL